MDTIFVLAIVVIKSNRAVVLSVQLVIINVLLVRHFGRVLHVTVIYIDINQDQIVCVFQAIMRVAIHQDVFFVILYV